MPFRHRVRTEGVPNREQSRAIQSNYGRVIKRSNFHNILQNIARLPLESPLRLLPIWRVNYCRFALLQGSESTEFDKNRPRPQREFVFSPVNNEMPPNAKCARDHAEKASGDLALAVYRLKSALSKGKMTSITPFYA